MKWIRKLLDRLKRKPAEPAQAAPQQEVELPASPFLLISITPDGKLDQTCFFPTLPPEQGKGAVESFAMLLHLLHSGQMLPVLQKAVAIGGTAGDYQQGFAHAVLVHLNEFVEDKAGRKANSKLVVPPRKVFGFHTNGNG